MIHKYVHILTLPSILHTTYSLYFTLLHISPFIQYKQNTSLHNNIHRTNYYPYFNYISTTLMHTYTTFFSQ